MFYFHVATRKRSTKGSKQYLKHKDSSCRTGVTKDVQDVIKLQQAGYFPFPLTLSVSLYWFECAYRFLVLLNMFRFVFIAYFTRIYGVLCFLCTYYQVYLTIGCFAKLQLTQYTLHYYMYYKQSQRFNILIVTVTNVF